MANKADYRVTGYRIGPQPTDETEHFIKCPDCGRHLDMRDLGEILIHEEECTKANGQFGVGA